MLSAVLLAGCQSVSCDVSTTDSDFAAARERMVRQQLAAPGRDITNACVLAVMGKVPRHELVPARLRAQAYGDYPLPIGHDQTISQPFIVAFMTEKLEPKPTDKVLEIGTGSGYQAAVLAAIVKEVYTIEIVIPLAERARTLLAALGYGNVTVKFGDGYRGWEERAPFDAIIITAAADRIPPPLIDQLRDGGRLVMPLGRTVFFQTLVVATKRNGTLTVRELAPVAFVPMTGEAEKQG